MKQVNNLTTTIASMKFLPDDSNVILGLVNGRVCIEVINGNANNSFKFRCHREPQSLFGNQGKQKCYTVNSIDYCADRRSLLTAGSDGKLFIWSIETKQKIKELQFEDGVETMGMHVALRLGSKGSFIVSVADRDSDLYGVAESCQSSKICVSINK